ncbi:NAD-dependent epimerase/dehydratase family protein [Microvirga roseola]|uniref:NAD-dependent epimerase/dehydratase family protein n=1 Tax=Microvirga roseola TaxID=2883126 RepID=UPI001E582796|nr:NAD-dependent epimerase/dehydratase family protein [Microvirga roseola]
MPPQSMKGERVFITGGAGFIGSRLVQALAALNADITIFDNLLQQVHGPSPVIDLPGRMIVGDIRDAAALAGALGECRPTIVVHLAAETGTGQSADEPVRYVDVNVGGTARLIEALKQLKDAPSRVVLAATRAVYGEGAYLDNAGRTTVPLPRQPSEMARGVFDLYDKEGNLLTPIPTPEHVPPAPGSVYGSSKLMQEYLLQQVAAPWQAVILRLQNVYGPGQSLRNPYTGVLSIFCQQALAGRTLNIFEDGNIHRDFVFVDDVVAAFVAACHEPGALGRTINIGTGERTSIHDAAILILRSLGLPTERLAISGEYRAGDIRHAVADITLARALLKWTPNTSFSRGIAQLSAWSMRETT